MQRKAVTEVVVDPAHEETQTLETDFFSTYFFDNYETKNNGQPHKLRQKVGVAAYLNNLYGGAWPSLADVFNVVTSYCVQLLVALSIVDFFCMLQIWEINALSLDSHNYQSSSAKCLFFG